MNHMIQPLSPDQALAHYGVKGMRWGVRKKESDPLSYHRNRIAKIDRKLDRGNAEKVGQRMFQGIQYRSAVASKMIKKGKLPPRLQGLSREQVEKFERQISRKTVNTLARSGAIETAAFLAGGNIAVSAMLTRPESRLGGRIGVALISGQVGALRVSQIRAVKTYERGRRLAVERDEHFREIRKLEKQMKSKNS